MVVNFEQIKGEACHLEPHFLQNQDIKNMYLLYCLVTGQISVDDFMSLVPGPINLARWYTINNNIFCLWIITENPEIYPNLRLIVEFLVKVYCPTIFDIKKQSHVSQGPKHFFNALRRSRVLLHESHPNLWNEVKETFQWNGYSAHIENVLLALVCDTDVDGKVRQQAINIIGQRRKKTLKTVRKFIKPVINFEAESYYTMIDLRKFTPRQFASPPLLRDYSMEAIKEMKFEDNFWRIPCHSQSVERWVANTTMAAKCAIGPEQRHSWLVNFDQNTGQISTNPTKKEFVNALKER